MEGVAAWRIGAAEMAGAEFGAEAGVAARCCGTDETWTAGGAAWAAAPAVACICDGDR